MRPCILRFAQSCCSNLISDAESRQQIVRVLLVARRLSSSAWGTRSGREPVEVDLAKVERGTLRVTVDEDGKTRIREKYVVSAPLVGRLLRINMDAGDAVVAGKTLLTMIEPRDPDLLDARTVAQAEARVKAAEATLKKMEPMLEEVRAAQAFAEAELTRARKAARQRDLQVGTGKRRVRLSPKERGAALDANSGGDRPLRAGAGRGRAAAARGRATTAKRSTATATRPTATAAGRFRSIRRSTAACSACCRRARPS